ncbi:MAG: HupE / UreJ protein [Verrucomicrobia bacterium]|nr:MAG: HupE / UreJ protein [Verrucomicrobiota bacterium]
MYLPKIILRMMLVCSLLCLASVGASAHPIPDIPVCGSFEEGGTATFSVEVNPRCFDQDPVTATSLTQILFSNLTEARKAEMLAAAVELVKKNVEFFLEPIGRIQPEFQFEFTGEGRRALEKDEDVVVLSGRWRTTVPAGVSGWNIRSMPETKVSVVFQNIVNGTPHPRVAVLFPGERSYTLDLTQWTGALPSKATEGSVPASGGSGDLVSTVWSFCKQGFGHVVPEGLDHILFVLGLFLLGRAWRPLVWQVSAFTLAHSVTLALATAGKVNAPSKVVQPLIAATIAFVAVENIWRGRYTHSRLAVVFVFGLVHGMGFASALGDLSIPKGSTLAALGGFNLGVEGGQLAVIAGALVLTGWLRNEQTFRRWVAIPGSALIGLTGVYWTLERLVS